MGLVVLVEPVVAELCAEVVAVVNSVDEVVAAVLGICGSEAEPVSGTEAEPQEAAKSKLTMNTVFEIPRKVTITNESRDQGPLQS